MRVLILMTSILLVACQTAEGHPHKADKAKNDVVVSPGKPQHPLQVQLVRPERLRAGIESEVELVVDSAYKVQDMSIELKPDGGMVVSEQRFERRNGELSTTVRLPFTVIPAADDQRLTVHVKATMPDGRVISREVLLSLSETRKATKDHTARKTSRLPEHDAPTSEDDVVVRSEQEVIKDDGQR